MNIIQFVEQIEKNKIAIIRTWIKIPVVLDLIKIYSIDENLFIKRYSFSLIEHFILVVRKEEEYGKNSSVIDFLKYLKKKNMKIKIYFFN